MILISGLRRSLKTPEIRAQKIPIIVGLTRFAMFGNEAPNDAGEQRVLYGNDPYSPQSKISPLARREGGFVEALTCHMRRNIPALQGLRRTRPRPKDKADIIRGDDFHNYEYIHNCSL